MAEGSFAQAHSTVLRLVILGASLAVVWAVAGAIAAPSSASAVEPDSDSGSLAVLDVVTDVYPVDEIAVPLGEPAVAITDVDATDVAVTDLAGTDVAVTDVAVADVAVTDLAVTDVAVTDLAAAIGQVGAVTAPILNTLAPVDELLASVPITFPVVVAPAAETAAAAVEPARDASRALPGHAPLVASGEVAASAPQDLPVPSAPSPANRPAVLAPPAKSAGSGGANGIPTAAAEALFGGPAAPGTAELAIAGVHDAPLSPSPGALDSPPD